MRVFDNKQVRHRRQNPELDEVTPQPMIVPEQDLKSDRGYVFIERIKYRFLFTVKTLEFRTWNTIILIKYFVETAYIGIANL